jgi:hypothetical protein
LFGGNILNYHGEKQLMIDSGAQLSFENNFACLYAHEMLTKACNFLLEDESHDRLVTPARLLSRVVFFNLLPTIKSCCMPPWPRILSKVFVRGMKEDNHSQSFFSQALYTGKGIRPKSDQSFIRPEWLGPAPSEIF